MSAGDIVRQLPKPQRDSLVANIDGPLPVKIGPDSATRASLLSKGLLRYVITNRHLSSRPHCTTMTEKGREVLATMLAEYAEALVRTGCLDAVPPIKVPRAAAPKIAPEPDGSEKERALYKDWRRELTAG